MKAVRKQVSLKWQMAGIVLLCWLLPFLLVLAVTGWYISDSLGQRAVRSLTDQFEVNLRMCAMRLDSAAEASRMSSYDPSIKNAWKAYQNSGLYNVLYRDIKTYLDRQYRADNRFRYAVFWLNQDPDRPGMSTLTESAGAVYDQIRTDYWQTDHPAVKELAAMLDTSIAFLKQEDRLYLVRNVLDANYRTIGTLVLALNQPYYFENLIALPWASSLSLSLDRVSVPIKGEGDDPEARALGKRPVGLYWDAGFRVLEQQTKGSGYTLKATAVVDFDVLLSQFSAYKYLLGGMVLLLLPLLLFTFFYLQRKVSRPVAALMKGAKEIEHGQLGHQLNYRANSREFHYLTESFNNMSSQLERQFNRIYKEELALRDARIKALQSNINPHFLNNTLEIINWEARMNGAGTVSKMIEALSTVLDAAIDRRKKPEVRLREELTYASAYLYIIGMRFGKRLTVTQSIPEELLDCMVPRLILQPVIENAVEHGIGPGGHGQVDLLGRLEGSLLLLEVFNDGTISPQDRAHIDRLLSPDYDSSQETAGNIGIRNVDQRLRILYGPPSGLTLEACGTDRVVARLTIKINLY